MRVAIYVRVSTKKQTVDMQLHDLQAVALRSGWNITAIYRDEGISGTKSSDDRPALKQLIRASTRREFDMVAIWSIDRLARSTLDLFHIMLDLHSKRIELYVHKQAIDTSTPSGRMMWQLLGVFAEFERSVIQERVKAGIENARSRGVKLGRPVLSKEIELKIIELRQQGWGMLKIGRTLKVGTSQVQRICTEMKLQQNSSQLRLSNDSKYLS